MRPHAPRANTRVACAAALRTPAASGFPAGRSSRSATSRSTCGGRSNRKGSSSTSWSSPDATRSEGAKRYFAQPDAQTGPRTEGAGNRQARQLRCSAQKPDPLNTNGAGPTTPHCEPVVFLLCEAGWSRCYDSRPWRWREHDAAISSQADAFHRAIFENYRHTTDGGQPFHRRGADGPDEQQRIAVLLPRLRVEQMFHVPNSVPQSVQSRNPLKGETAGWIVFVWKRMDQGFVPQRPPCLGLAVRQQIPPQTESELCQ